ncbi:TetR/AcrR family transcriptional regulator [Kangiella taiwanensis]|uniref:TetR/AcrR family transcriptional regulator n=1 Tax=Kangiella taiwanensis TaxID=1079179 RepID=A0ABP8HS86_9GAMM|nr:TetR/AcrR family transcriptional regulator [Kangiella taiwanensis]
MPQKKQLPKREHILDTAIKMFLKQGVSKTSIEQIASAAKVSKITLYNHFDNKESLFIAGLEEVNKRVVSKIPDIDHMSGSPEERLRKFSQRIVRILVQPDTVALFRVIISEAEHHPQVPINFLQYVKIPIMQSLTKLLSEFTFDETVVKKADIAAEIFFGILKERVLWPLLLKLKVHFSESELESIADESVSGLMHWVRN